jgi:hypothetical protein
MPRRFQLLWIPVLVSLFAGPLLIRPSGDLRAQAIRGGESIESASSYTLPAARSVPALQPRLQAHRQSSPSWAAVPGHREACAFEQRLVTPPVQTGRDALARTARHFPLFPTGPPAHS